MNQRDFSELNFNRPRRSISGRWVWMAGLLVGFGLAWSLIPSSPLFWLLLALITGLGWAASFGWRRAAQILSTWLNRIQKL